MWEIECKPPFEVPSNAKRSISVLDKSTNIWKYKADLVYYDGTKKEFTFRINIDTGEQLK